MKKRRILLLPFFICIFIFHSTPASSKEIIPFGLCPKYNPRIMYQLYQPFVDYLSENTPYQFEIKLSSTYRETINRFGTGEIVIGSCGPVPYIKAREKYPVTPIVRALSGDGKPHYRGMIIVRQDSPIQNLSDLKGKRFAFGQALSTTGHILPEYHLMKANIRLKDLKEYAFLRHHDSVVNAVLKGQFDAGAVKDIVAYKYQKDGLRFISVTDPTPTVPIVARTDVSQKMVKSVKTALLKLDPKDPNYRKKMAQWDEEFKYGFTEASDSDYDPIRRILRTIPVDQGMKGKIQD
jgi:phosphonate transport system substrate-binding protein